MGYAFARRPDSVFWSKKNNNKNYLKADRRMDSRLDVQSENWVYDDGRSTVLFLEGRMEVRSRRKRIGVQKEAVGRLSSRFYQRIPDGRYSMPSLTARSPSYLDPLSHSQSPGYESTQVFSTRSYLSYACSFVRSIPAVSLHGFLWHHSISTIFSIAVPHSLTVTSIILKETRREYCHLLSLRLSISIYRTIYSVHKLFIFIRSLLLLVSAYHCF